IETPDSNKVKEKIKYFWEIINTSTLLPIGRKRSAEINGLSVTQRLNQIEMYSMNISAEIGRFRLGLGMQYMKHSDSLKTSIREDASYDNWDVFADDSLYWIGGNNDSVIYIWDSTYSYIVDSIDQPYSHINNYKYFEIPLSFSYHIIHTPTITWSLTATITNSFLIGSPSQNVSSIKQVKDIFNGVTNKYVPSFGASSEVLVHMDERVSVKLGLSYKHGFKPLGNSAQYPIKKRYLMGLSFGIQYLLNDI
ncbi:MAG: hypothetical protein IH948_08365, partial [Bacteroidetes bacterium]|nr:hypothetical protein [Bacteroidota bacterium]